MRRSRRQGAAAKAAEQLLLDVTRQGLSRLLHLSVGGIAAVPSRSSPTIMVQTAEHGDVHDLSIAARRVRRAEWDKLTHPLVP